MTARRFGLGFLAFLALIAVALWRQSEPAPHNVIIFVADGLRSGIVTPDTAPALAAVRSEGVDFHNSHSLFPTVTTPNASAIATGHRLGDTGDFANVVYAGAARRCRPASATWSRASRTTRPRLQLNDRFGGDYLHETSLLAAARAAGFSTAAIGKLGPAGVQDVGNARQDLEPSSSMTPAGTPDGVHGPGGESSRRSRPRAWSGRRRIVASTPIPATTSVPACMSPMSSSRTGSPSSPPRCCCRAFQGGA